MVDTSSAKMVTARWKASWYRLDQSVQIGQYAKFWFHSAGPQNPNAGEELCFFNALHNVEQPAHERMALVISIHHPQLGLLERIDTDGLDYVFYLADGAQLIVNAEEEPGQIYDEDLPVTDWEFEIKLAQVSEPLTKTA